MCIERKTVNDLSNSIKDGRYKEQKLRLKSMECSNVSMIVEGRIPTSGFVSGLPVSTLRSAIVNSFLRDRVLVLTTSSVKDTALYVLKLLEKCVAHNITSSEVPVDKTLEKYGDVISIVKKKNMTPEVCFKAQLKTIPGVSNAVANTIFSEHKSMKQFIDFLSDESKKRTLSDMVLTSDSKRKRKLGDKLATTITEYLL